MENWDNIFLRNTGENLYIQVEQSQKARIKIAVVVVVVVVVVPVPVAVIWYNNNNNQLTLQQYMYQSIFLWPGNYSRDEVTPYNNTHTFGDTST